MRCSSVFKCFSTCLLIKKNVILSLDGFNGGYMHSGLEELRMMKAQKTKEFELKLWAVTRFLLDRSTEGHELFFPKTIRRS